MGVTLSDGADLAREVADVVLTECRLDGDMEAGRLHTVDDAFQIIRDRMKNEL